MKGRWMLVLAALCAAPAAAAAQPYTLTPWAGITEENFRSYHTGMIASFGSRFENGVMVERGGFGETFTVDVGSTLVSWTLRHNHCQLLGSPQTLPGPCVFRAYVAGLDPGSGKVTNLLWESPAYDPASGSTSLPFTPGIWLDPGKYVGFVLWQPVSPGPAYTGWALHDYSEINPVGDLQAPASPGMELVTLTTRDPALPPGRTGWYVNHRYDAQNFRATLDSTVTPEPASMALLGTGLAALAGAARRRRRRQEAATAE